MHPTCLGEGSGVIWTSYRGMYVVMSLLPVCLVCPVYLSICLCVVLLICMLLLSTIICTFRSAIMAIVLIPVMVGWGDRMEPLLFLGPLRKDISKL